MSLDNFGKIAAIEIPAYAPILCAAFYLILKKDFNRREGWVFLFIFSLVRIIGAVTTLDLKLQTNPSTGLFVAAAILQGIGLSPLLLATLGIVSTMSNYVYNARYPHLLRLLRMVLAIALIMGILGGTKSSPGHDAQTISDGRKFSKIASVLFLLAFAGVVGAQVLLWGERSHMSLNHRKLLLGVSLAVPPLFIRIVYSLLNSFASSQRNRWSPFSGTWWIYLIMGAIMEYLVVSIYVITGMVTFFPEDEAPQARGISVPVLQTTSEDTLMEMGIRKWRQARRFRRGG